MEVNMDFDENVGFANHWFVIREDDEHEDRQED